MSPSFQSPAAPPRAAGTRSSRLIWVVVVLCIGLPSLLVYGVMSSFSLGGDAAALRDAVHQGGGLELRLGSWTLGAVRAGAGCLGTEPEIQNFLSSVRRIECGVYPITEGQGTSPVDLLSAGDKVMKSRGWSRVVGVMDSGDVVGVYAQDAVPDAEDVSLCVLVRHQEHLVIAGGSCRVTHLLELLGDEGRRFAGGQGFIGGHPRMF
ncbi:MAG: hypothetical protein U1G08_09155 [Verrucomicrobiota bacterium]